MKLEPSEIDWDVVIVHAAGRAADAAYRLRDGLVRCQLRVKLHIVPAPTTIALPGEVLVDVGRARHCVMLVGVQDDVPGSDATVDAIAYASTPRAKAPGRRPVVGTAGAKVAFDAIETGRVGDDVEVLARRIAARVRAWRHEGGR
ncbi:MAG: hypothetical protein Q8K82_11205 [Gemmatimonadaceae bacterium]|nr:hypothetical protein [Gemmatimonadaceae bacterium]